MTTQSVKKGQPYLDDKDGWCKADIEPDHIPHILRGHGGWMKNVNGYQDEMVQIYEHYCSDGMIDQIYKAGSDSRNESLHTTITAISLKREFFLRSGTYRAQVLAGSLQKNWGQGWQKRPLQELGVLYATDANRPGTILLEKLKRSSKRDAEHKLGKVQKRRRMELKYKRKKKAFHLEKTEGGADAMYSSKGFELLPGPRVEAVADVPMVEMAAGDEDSEELAESDGLPTDSESEDDGLPIGKMIRF